MKLTHLLATSLPAIAGVMLLHSTAQAQVQATYNPDDLFLGFRTTAGVGAFDYIVNIGQASNYRDFSGTSFTLSFGNIQADLVANFGANWFNRADLFWGVSGTTGLGAVGIDPANTLYASREELTFGTISQLWQRGSNTAQGTTRGKMNTLANQYIGYMSTANSNFGVTQGASDVNSYASFMPGGANSGAAPGTSFGAFNPTIEGSFANGAAGTQLDLVRLLPSASGGTGEFVGAFTIDSSAGITFYNNVPEPSSFLALGAGAGLLGMLRRRRNS